MIDAAPIVHIVDDDPSIRSSLKWLLESAGMKVKLYASAAEMLALETLQRPGCLVLDLRMPGMSGLQLQEALTARGALLPILFITGHGDTSSAVRAMKGGAVDFIEKPFSDQQFLEAVSKALAMDEASLKRQVDCSRVSRRLEQLSERERAVLGFVVEGESSRSIGERLGISVRTVEAHRNGIMKKLGARNVAELVRLAISGVDGGSPQGGVGAA